MAVLLLLLVAIIGLICLHHWLRSRNFPPGYPRYPIIGSALHMRAIGSQVMLDVAEDAHKYCDGKMMGLFAGPFAKVVIIHDYELAKKVSNDDVLLGRVVTNWNKNIRGSGKATTGILWTQDHMWRNNRRFALSTLKEFGYGKTSICSVVEDEALDIVKHLKTFHGQDFLVDQTFNVSIFNVIWTLVAGKRYEATDPNMTGLMKGLAVRFRSAFVDEMLPFLKYILPNVSGIPLRKKHAKMLKDMFGEIIGEHKSNEDLTRPSQDLIEAYLKELKSSNPLFDEDQLVGMLFDFFEAGGETVGSTLTWFLMYFVLHPDIQEKCAQEVAEALGEKSPVLEDKELLPYTEATIMEFQRISCVAPGGLDHTAKADTTLLGYSIPKGTRVYYNLYKFHHDKDYWGDPETFRPERFLTEDRTKVVKKEYFNPFGLGKRICMGESLAKVELFIFTVIILRHLKLSVAKRHPRPDMDDAFAGVTRGPNPFYIHIEQRAK